jgi:4-hydroxy-tetrahydrodipicolinate synthase
MVDKSGRDAGGFSGVFSAMVTPMTRDGEVDYAGVRKFTEYLVDSGVHGLTPLGSTGEFYALSPDEREKVLHTVLEAVGGRVPVVPGTNAGSTREAIAYSRKAERMGATGVMLAAPYYSLPTQEELFAHFKAINNAVGVPIMIYNYPGRTGVDMGPEFIARLAELKNVKYVKESTGEMPRIAMLRRLCGDKIGVFCGCDTIALQAFLVGAIGWVGGVVNVVPRCHVKLYELGVEKRDFAAGETLFEKMLPLLELMEGGGKYTQFVKAACGLMGHAVGAPRGPLAAATKAEAAQLKGTLKFCSSEERG